jgi:protein SCO1
MRRKGIAGLAALTAFLFAAILFLNHPPAARALDNARWGANYFPNIELTDQYGNKHHFYDDLLKGKLVAIDMIYTHCVDSCPLETARLVEVQKLLGDRVGKDIFFYSITLDPKRDTPEVLKAYADKYHVGPGWLFLTGKGSDIELVGRKLGLYSDPDPSNRDGHTASLLLGNEPAGEWTRSTATDNPRFLSVMIGDRLDSWKHLSSEPKPSYAEAQELHLDQGRYLFKTHCAACHTIGHGDKIGPDLLGVTNVRDHTWLASIIQTPDKVLAGGDPIASALFKKYNEVQMPNLRVSAPDAAALIKFLQDETAAAAQPKEPEKTAEKAPEKSASASSVPGSSER